MCVSRTHTSNAAGRAEQARPPHIRRCVLHPLLVPSCTHAQVPPGNVTIIHDPRLLDGMDKAWVPAVVAHYVQQQLKQHPCDTVLTFDSYGVSGHINHKGTHEGVR